MKIMKSPYLLTTGMRNEKSPKLNAAVFAKDIAQMVVTHLRFGAVQQVDHRPPTTDLQSPALSDS
jgi:hypothetical protein